MVKRLGRGLLGRLGAYGILLFGFWALYRGFLRPSIPLVVVGGVLILAGMWVLVSSRKGSPTESEESPTNTEEDNPGDSLD